MPNFRKLLDLDTPGVGPSFPLGDFSAGGVDFSSNGCHTPRMSFKNTPAQDQAIAAYRTGGNVLLRAGAGTGKTSTLRLMAASEMEKRVLLIAFNRSVKEMAEKTFSGNVLALTSSGLANRAHRAAGKTWLLDKCLSNRPTSPVDVSKFLKMPFQHVIEGNDGEVTLFQGWQLASAAVRMVTRFCHSADTEIQAYHAPKYDKLTKDQNKSLAIFLLPFARKVWADVNNQSGTLTFRQAHDLYFKVWALTNPVLDFDAIFVDEAQDTNPALAAVIAAQTTQVIMVGDECQAIYAWRGAIDAMSAFQADHVVTLDQSFRFGQAVAEVANGFLARLDAPLRITGAGPESTVERLSAPDAILCRTNAGAIEAAISQLEAGRTVALVGDMAKEIKSFVDAAEKLMNGKRVQHADLAPFKTWQEVVEFAGSDEGRELRMIVSLVTKYGVEGLRSIVSQTIKPEDADVTISTAHKAKGLEWGSVMIWGDFKVETEEGGKISTAELMLMYVAVTRAMKTLDPGILRLLAL